MFIYWFWVWEYTYIRFVDSRIVLSLFLRRTPGVGIARRAGDRGMHGILYTYIRVYTAAQRTNHHINTIRRLQILYIITPSTGIDKVRTGIVILRYGVLGIVVVLTFTHTPHTSLHAARFAITIPTMHDFCNIALQLLDCIVIFHR